MHCTFITLLERSPIDDSNSRKRFHISSEFLELSEPSDKNRSKITQVLSSLSWVIRRNTEGVTRLCTNLYKLEKILKTTDILTGTRLSDRLPF